MRYGVPYKGSKNGISEWIVKQSPKKKNFYDLFAGGCAITHCAMMSNKFDNFIINDITDSPKLFTDAVNGKYQNEKRWISREDFYRLRDCDNYIKLCWSFGNSGNDYLYSKEVEPWKKALHYARLYDDFSFLKEFGIDTKDASRIWIAQNHDICKEKYVKWYLKNVLRSTKEYEELKKNLKEKIKDNSEKLRDYLVEGLRKANKRPCDVDKFLGTNGMACHYFGKSQWEFPTREVYEKLQDFICLPRNYDEIYGLQELLQSLERLQKSYDKIEILSDSVIYCDIPYRNTDAYFNQNFDYEKFYSWAERQTEPCFISEYWLPEDRFECIAEIEKKVTLCSGGGKSQIEKLFVPKSQIKMIKAISEKRYKQLKFDFD
jgi:hypothetical protein